MCARTNLPFRTIAFDYAQDLGVSVTFDSVSTVTLPFSPDIICSNAMNITKKHILDLVSGKAFNLHPSLLPSYRGCSSLTWAMINGEKKVGPPYHYIDEGCDTEKFYCRDIEIFPFDNQNNLYQRTMHVALII